MHAWLADNPGGNPPAETIIGPAAGVNYPEVRASDGSTISIAAGGSVTVTHQGEWQLQYRYHNRRDNRYIDAIRLSSFRNHYDFTLSALVA